MFHPCLACHSRQRGDISVGHGNNPGILQLVERNYIIYLIKSELSSTLPAKIGAYRLYKTNNDNWQTVEN